MIPGNAFQLEHMSGVQELQNAEANEFRY
jgi:hypothetical protein